ncbi:MAG: glycosyltransferase [Candidatus Latescibacteria bacterium]|nr:glycosyltransferase [Candidatus Latescibacterota bacterium]
MRILILSHGSSVHTRRWVEALEERGHALRLLTAEPPRGYRVSSRVVGMPIPVRAFRYVSALGAVRREIREFRPDVTVAHFLPNYGFLAALSGTRPFALVCWGSDLLLNARRTPLHRARARFVLRRADLIHVDAAVLADAAISLGAPPGRVWTRAWGVDPGAFASTAGGRPADGATRPIRIVWTRHFERVYDPLTFVRALAALKRRGVPFHASMAGGGRLKGPVETMLREEGLVNEVRLEGVVDSARLRELYFDGDVYVSLSRSDSTSQSLLEAMAAGLFPVVTDIEGNREWITHRREGYLVPPGDADATACAIAEAAGDPDADAIRSRARAAVRSRGRFDETVAQVEEKLRSLAAGRGRA